MRSYVFVPIKSTEGKGFLKHAVRTTSEEAAWLTLQKHLLATAGVKLSLADLCEKFELIEVR